MTSFVVRLVPHSPNGDAIKIACHIMNDRVRGIVGLQEDAQSPAASVNCDVTTVAWGDIPSLRFVCGLLPDEQLLGFDFFAKAEVDQWLEVATQIEFHQKHIGDEVGIHHIKNLLARLNWALLSRTYIGLHNLTAADILLSCQLVYLSKAETFHQLWPLPQNVSRWLALCTSKKLFTDVLGEVTWPAKAACDQSDVSANEIRIIQPKIAPFFTNSHVEALHRRLIALNIPFPTPMNPEPSAEQLSWAKSLLVTGKVGKAKKVFMVTTRSSVRVDMKSLGGLLSVSDLRLASPDDVSRIVHVDMGCVTALSVFMDTVGACTSVLDKALVVNSAGQPQTAPLRMCVGCLDAHDPLKHNISECPPAALLQLLLQSGHTPVMVDFDSSKPVLFEGATDLVAKESALLKPIEAISSETTFTELTNAERLAEEAIVSFLAKQNIPFVLVRHEAVMTVDKQMTAMLGQFQSSDILLKNLFLKDKKGKLTLVSARANAQVNLKNLCKQLGVASGSLRFADSSVLLDVLGVQEGAVTPLALVNDTNGLVTFVVDRCVENASRVWCHPNHNKATLAITGQQLLHVIASNGHSPMLLEFEEKSED